MSIELKVPTVGPSITEVQIVDWLKSPGEAIRQDEPLVSIETEKAVLDLPAPISGILARILKKNGETAMIGEVTAYLEEATVQEEPAAPLASPGAPLALSLTPDYPFQHAVPFL